MILIQEGFMLRKVFWDLVILGVIIVVFTKPVVATQPTAPFDVSIHLDHLPNIGEEVAVICSVTALPDADSTEMRFWCTDTVNAEITKDQECLDDYKFKKGETKEYRFTIVFKEEGYYHLIALIRNICSGWIEFKHKDLYIQTHRDKAAEIVDSIPLIQSPGPRLTGARLDSLNALRERRRQYWLKNLIAGFEKLPVGDPPQSIWRYEYKGQTVYYVPPQCCDQYSTLYDANGIRICAPDGGITGLGDGKCPDFFQERKDEKLIWQDPRER
jgi:hypothetical protein